MKILSGKRAVVGLDLGAGAVKAVELRQRALRGWAFAPVTDGEQQAGQAGAAAIRQALREGAPGARKAVVGLNAGEVLMHRFRLPADLPPVEVEEQARIQAGQAAPYPVAEACYDYRAEGAGGQHVNYRMGIARSAVVQALCRRVEEAGLKVAAVDLMPFAIERALSAPSPRRGSWAVLDGGYAATRLSVYRDGELAFEHSQPFGCRQLAQRLSLALGLTPAETRKAIGDCRAPGGAAGTIRESFLEDLARHATRALQLYLASRPEAPMPERLFAWGGSALVHKACETLANALSVPVELADPLRRLAGGGETPDYSPVLLGALALALNDHA